SCFFFHVPSTAVISALSLHDALPISRTRAVHPHGVAALAHVSDWAAVRPGLRHSQRGGAAVFGRWRRHHGRTRRRDPVSADPVQDRKSTRLNSSHLGISYAVFCLKKK